MGREQLAQIEYEEIQSSPKWALVLGLSIMVVAAALVIFNVSSDVMPGFLILIWAGVIIFFVFIIANFARLKVAVTSEELIVSYGLWHHRIARPKITKVEKVELTFMNTGGIGIRATVDGTVYNTRWGKGLIVEYGAKHPFLFSANNPEQIKQILTSS